MDGFWTPSRPGGAYSPMLERVIFVSEARFVPEEAESEVDRIAAQARRSNAARDVTGGLVYTGRHFAVLLEGPPETLEALLAQIRRDSRHARVTVLTRGPITRRHFHALHMAYSGRASYLDRQIAPFLNGALDVSARQEALAQLEALIGKLAEMRHEAAPVLRPAR